MTIDKAIRQLHLALNDDFRASSIVYQLIIIKTLEDLLEKLKLPLTPPP